MKLIYHTGHSQGGGLAQVAALYHKLSNRQRDIRSWVFSTPRVFDIYTSKEVDKIFKVKEQSFKFIR